MSSRVRIGGPIRFSLLRFLPFAFLSFLRRTTDQRGVAQPTGEEGGTLPFTGFVAMTLAYMRI